MRPLNRATLLSLAILQASAAAAQAPPPFCGSNGRDLGDGFRLTQYMFGGSRDFALRYDVPDEAVDARGVVVAAAPIRLLFWGLDGRDIPTIGFENFDVREADGRKFDLRTVRFECGGGHRLSVTFGAHFPPNQPARPISFMSPFFSERARIPACLAALEESGRFTLSFARSEVSAPVLVLQGPLPFRAKLHRARRLWEEDMARAGEGRCRIAPPPPPPF